MTAALIGFTATGAEGEPAVVAQPSTPVKATSHCPSARSGLVFYRTRFSYHRRIRGLGTPWPAGRKPRSCADAQYLAEEVWPARAFRERMKTEKHLKWVAEHTLRDFEVRDGNHAWLKAVDEVQKVYPGSGPWLRSCSAPTSEGGWGRWVTYQDAYSAEYAAANYIVGGWLQFKLPTFKGFFRHALEDVRELGYRIPSDLKNASDVQAWQSPLAQALAGGWAYRNGETGHWVGSGC